MRFARRSAIGDADLVDAIRRAENGTIEADLGAGLIKQRIGRQGQGRSGGGVRTIVAYRSDTLAVFLYGFAKNDRENITAKELATLRVLSAALLTETTIDTLVRNGGAEEMDYE